MINLMLRLAQLIARTEALGPYPGWCFAAGESNPTHMTEIRLAIWKRCNQKRLQRPIKVSWYDGLTVYSYLGNDLSRMLFVGGCFEPNEFFFLHNVLRRGMTFIDVGANEGLYTLFAARRIGPEGMVIAVEPSQREYARLQANLHLNELTNVECFKIALSHRSGRARLKVVEYEHEGQNTLGQFVYPGIESSHSEEVKLRQLDALVTEQSVSRVDFIKVDAEGSESKVLQGAQNVLATDHPILLLELLEEALRQQASSKAEILALLRLQGYEFFVFDPMSGRPAKAQLDSQLSGNVIAAHPDGPRWELINEAYC